MTKQTKCSTEYKNSLIDSEFLRALYLTQKKHAEVIKKIGNV